MKTHKNGPEDHRRLADKCRETRRTVLADNGRADPGHGANLGPYSRSPRTRPSLGSEKPYVVDSVPLMVILFASTGLGFRAKNHCNPERGCGGGFAIAGLHLRLANVFQSALAY